MKKILKNIIMIASIAVMAISISGCTSKDWSSPHALGKALGAGITGNYKIPEPKADQPIINGMPMIMNDMRSDGEGLGDGMECYNPMKTSEGLEYNKNRLAYSRVGSSQKNMHSCDVYLIQKFDGKKHRLEKAECKKVGTRGFFSADSPDEKIWDASVARKWNKVKMFKNPFDKPFVENGKNVLIIRYTSQSDLRYFSYYVLVQYRYNTPEDLDYIKKYVAPHDYMVYLDGSYKRKFKDGGRSKHYHEDYNLARDPFILSRYDVLKRESILRNVKVSISKVIEKEDIVKYHWKASSAKKRKTTKAAKKFKSKKSREAHLKSVYENYGSDELKKELNKED